MKKIYLFLAFAIVITFMSGCKKDDDSTKGAARVISGIVMDENHNPVRNGEVHIITPEGRGEFLGWCERTVTIEETDDNGYFKAGIGHDCRVVDEVDILVFNEEGAKINDVYAKLDLFYVSQDHLDGAGFNSPTGMFFPERLSYFTNHVTVNAINSAAFDVQDTLYFLLPADPWDNKNWHINKVSLNDGVASQEFSYKWTNSLNYFLIYQTLQDKYYVFVTADRELANKTGERFKSIPSIEPGTLTRHFPEVLDFERFELPHQNIGGENHIYLTVKKENGKIDVESE